MDDEISNFVKVWILTALSFYYCYGVGKITQKPTIRLITFLPVVCLFLLLPFSLHSIHLGCATTFSIAWVANFKVILFAFGLGPLSDPSLSMDRFIALGCLPIRIQQKDPNQTESIKGPNKMSLSPTGEPILNLTLKDAIKALILGFLLLFHNHRDNLHPKAITLLMTLYLYVGEEVLFTLVQIVARVMLRVELEPQFNDPYLSTSLQDFWGRRWNLTATDILRTAVYRPLLHLSRSTLGPIKAQILARMATFLVSGLMHEIIMVCITRARPNWESTSYFLIHGLCLTLEVMLKKKLPRKWELPVVVSRVLTFGFVIITFMWVIMPQVQMHKVDITVINEYFMVIGILKGVLG